MVHYYIGWALFFILTAGIVMVTVYEVYKFISEGKLDEPDWVEEEFSDTPVQIFYKNEGKINGHD